ncbi:MAG: Ku protein [Syntrophales bacterium]|jgi:DNA end-binding protein Ku|nr:Ku protein [Syntrophales bacterium]MDD5232991.1 Ku protein [Syntrophales bacterium]MDD5531527.1 Ku protein [Syntrophales bacterium]HPL62228.1 Ku protein [Syntrophales bacterium]
MRAIWSGSISFGLINIPIRLFTAVRENRPDLDMLHRKDLSPIRYARVCRAEGEEIPYEEIVRGYQYRKGDYVILEEDDFKKADVRKTQTIEIMDFVESKEIDSKLMEKPYYLEPTKESGKAYALLREALKRTNRVGVGRFVLRTREHLVLLKPENGMMILEQIRFADEIVDSSQLSIPGDEAVSKRELDMAVKLVEQLSAPFHHDRYQDTYAEELMRIINEKAQGKVPEARGERPVPTGVPDLMSKLRESLEVARKKRSAA